jgi:sulfite reductase (NADPH) flavoprotein alpha-component
LAIGDTLRLRVRAHENFRLGSNARRPMILIGNGTGLAGLRAHLKARALLPGSRNWLLFGERKQAFDALYDQELREWEQRGLIESLDRVYSRDQSERRYVQHRLRECGAKVSSWIAEGAAVYVCGSLEGMAGGVEQALKEILGAREVEALSVAGRYRRDVY